MKKFKIRCSAIGHIMPGETGLTEKQSIELNKLQAKDKLTSLQELKIFDLIKKRDNQELPAGPKTYCKDWLKGQILDFKNEFSSKYTDKGNIKEDESIDFIADQLGYGFLLKNVDHYDNEWAQGTPDVLLKSLVIDVKNSWDANTFPLFETEIPNKAYWWQLQGYMWLCDKPKARLIYTLLDTPDHLIEKEARWESIRQGFEELEPAVYDKYYKNMTYTNIDPKHKIKVFDIERDEAAIEKIKERVLMCRDYIEQLKATL